MKPLLLLAVIPALLAAGCGDEFIASPIDDIPEKNDRIFFNPLDKTSGVYERRGVSVIAPDGSGYTMLTGDSCYISTGPRNGRIVYVQAVEVRTLGPNPSCRGKVMVMNTDGSGSTVIDSSADNDTFFEQKMYLSRDGATVTYVRNNVSEARSTIVVAPVDGGARKTFDLGNLPGFGAIGSFFDYRPSPDGRRIGLVMRDRTLRVLDLTTGVYTTIATGTSGDGRLNSFAWSPDGTRIAYCQVYGEDGYDAPNSLDIVNVSGGDRRSLVHGVSRILEIAWAPGGEQIVYSRFREGPPGGFTDLWLLSLSGDGEKPTNLTRTVTGVGDDYIVYWPQWSSDGSRILFSAMFSDLKTGDRWMSMVIADLAGKTMSIVRKDSYNGFW